MEERSSSVPGAATANTQTSEDVLTATKEVVMDMMNKADSAPDLGQAMSDSGIVSGTGSGASSTAEVIMEPLIGSPTSLKRKLGKRPRSLLDTEQMGEGVHEHRRHLEKPKSRDGSTSGSSTSGQQYAASPDNADRDAFTVEITPTTGGAFSYRLSPSDTVDGVRREIAKKLKVPKEGICLLHRDRLLENGRIQDYALGEGSRISLVPNVETGLLTQRPEQSVLEALEGLNESQVSDFLTGKSPLNLTMRLGDHVMLIQLQLSKGTHPSSSKSHGDTSSSGTTSKSQLISVTNPTAKMSSFRAAQHIQRQQNTAATATTATAAASRLTTTSAGSSDLGLFPPETVIPMDKGLAEASRNLTKTLKQLSSHVTKDEAITTHMQHHGKGVYSGTFSGTLNPALQDGLGKPKQHVSTIVHILNDLLGGMESKWGLTTTNPTPSTSSKVGSSPRAEPNQSTSKSREDGSEESVSAVYKCQEQPPVKRAKSVAPVPDKIVERERLQIKVEALKEQMRLKRESRQKEIGNPS